EARPEDLQDAAAGFFGWLEALVGMPEAELEPLLPLLVRWSRPAMARVLERWAALPTMRDLLLGGAPHSREFRRKGGEAPAARRGGGGGGGGGVPAAPPQGRGSEPAPARSQQGSGTEVASVQLEGI